MQVSNHQAFSRNKLREFIDERPEDGIYRVDRRIFTDPDIFEMEMKAIFESNWLYLTHESQLENTFDYITTYMGRQPVILNRGSDGAIHGYLNACSHRGTTLCRESRGNKKMFTCPFHGWVYDAEGKLISIKDPDHGGYPEEFEFAALSLAKIPMLKTYRGFIFGSLSKDVLPLEEHLGSAKILIDMLADQAPNGLEIVKGASTYTYDGNWKMQAENGVDGYHVTTVHRNYVMTTTHRKEINAGDKVKAMEVGRFAETPGGYFAFGHGHVLLWSHWANAQDRPCYDQREEFRTRYGETRADWMVGKLRNLLLYPNVFIMDQMSSQIRHFRPISVDKTEVTIRCIAPRGESDATRERRIRQYEDFFNASGMATPDDLAEFNACQVGARASLGRWNDLSRGAAHQVAGANEVARTLGLEVVSSGAKAEDEGIFLAQHHYWLDRMLQFAS